MTQYSYLWRNKWLTSGAKTIDDMVDGLKSAVNELEAMKNDGIVLEDGGGIEDDYANLVTEDPEIAKKYNMENNAEIDNEDNDDGENIIDIILRRLDMIEESLVLTGVGEFCPECGEYEHHTVNSVEPNNSPRSVCFIPPKKEEIN